MSEQNKSIQEKTDELNILVAWFDGDDFKLEQAIDKFNQAKELASEIESDLNNLKNEINIIKQKFDSDQ